MNDPYANVASANSYLAGHLFTDAWDSAPTSQQLAALRMASKSIQRLSLSITLPEEGSVGVPSRIQDAVIEEALALLELKQNGSTSNELRTTQHLTQTIRNRDKETFDVSRSPEHVMAGIMSPTAWDLLQTYLVPNRSINIQRV